MKRIIKFICTALVLLVTVFTVACAPSSIKKAKKKLESRGYEVVRIVEYDKNSQEYAYEGKKGVLVAKENTFGWSLEAHLFVSGKVANEFFEQQEKTQGIHIQRKDCWVVIGNYLAVESFLGNI